MFGDCALLSPENIQIFISEREVYFNYKVTDEKISIDFILYIS